MYLRSKSRYGFIAVLDLLHSEQKIVNLIDIAKRHDLPLPYLEQLFLKLKNAQIVKSKRGKNGGYSLNRAPNEISILDIVNAFEEKITTKQCSGKNSGCQKNGQKCSAHDIWDYIDKIVYKTLKNTTLQSIKDKQLYACFNDRNFSIFSYKLNKFFTSSWNTNINILIL